MSVVIRSREGDGDLKAVGAQRSAFRDGIAVNRTMTRGKVAVFGGTGFLGQGDLRLDDNRIRIFGAQ